MKRANLLIFLIVPALFGSFAAEAASPPDALLPGTILITGGNEQTKTEETGCGAGTISYVPPNTIFTKYTEFLAMSVPSSFMRSGTGPIIMTFTDNSIGFYVVDLSDSKKSIEDGYSGAAVLAFATSTGGTMVFDAPPVSWVTGSADPTHQKVPFSNYEQTFNASTKVLDVSFKVSFPNCSFTLKAIYHSS